MLGRFLFAQRQQRQNGIKHRIVSAVDSGTPAVLCKEDPRGVQGVVCLLEARTHQCLDVVTAHAAMPSRKMFMTRVLSDIGPCSNSSWAKHSPPYTFFLLNGDMELHRDRQLFV